MDNIRERYEGPELKPLRMVPKRPKRRKIWVIALLATFAVVGFFFWSHEPKKNAGINRSGGGDKGRRSRSPEIRRKSDKPQGLRRRHPRGNFFPNMQNLTQTALPPFLMPQKTCTILLKSKSDKTWNLYLMNKKKN